MLGIWEKASSEVVRQHFAFQVTPEDLKKSISCLKAKGIETSNFLDDDKGQLYVFGWMPAGCQLYPCISVIQMVIP